MSPTKNAITPIEPRRKPRIAHWHPEKPGADTAAPGKTHRTLEGKLKYFWSAWKTLTGRRAVAEGWTGARTVRLWGDEARMAARCRELQAEVIQWLHARLSKENPQINPQSGEHQVFFLQHVVPTRIRPRLRLKIPTANVVNLVETNRFDGTLGSLISLHRHSPESEFHKAKYTTQGTELRNMRRLFTTHGARRVEGLSRKVLFEMHQEFARNFCETTAGQVMSTLRKVLKFGIGLNRRGFPDTCAAAVSILGTMKFSTASFSPVRDVHLTADMAAKFIKAAHKMGAPSMALAQAIQFETALRQKDVIGEWWPGLNGTPKNQETWTSGLVWGEHISITTLIMVKPTSKSNFRKKMVADLSLCPLFLKEFRRLSFDDLSGPVIVNEKSGLPYRGNTFSIKWRRIATAAGIPDNIWNMDSRAGAITESDEAGVDLELLRKFASHSDAQMTRHYNRDALRKARTVHTKRARHRDGAKGNDYMHGPIIDV